MSTDTTIQPNTSEIKKDNVTITLNRFPGCLLKATVNLSPEAVEASYSKSLKSLSKDVSMPGFRKGRVPRNVLIERFHPHIEKHCKDLLVNVAFNEVMTESHLKPIRNDQVKAQVLNFSLQEGATINLEYEFSPQVPAIDLSLLQLTEVIPTPVTHESIHKELHDLQLHHCEWEKVEGRGVEENDFVELTIDLLGDNPQTLYKETRVSLEHVPSWVRKALIGLTPNSSKETLSERPEEASDDQPFSPAKVNIFLHAIYKPILPPIDDELAKKGGVNSLEVLKIKIVEFQTRRAQQEAQEALWGQAREQLIKQIPVDIPASVLASSRNAERQQYIQRLHQMGRELPITLTPAEEEAISLAAQQDLQLFFLVKRIAHDKQITVSEEELKETFNQQMKMLSQEDLERLDNIRMEDFSGRLHYMLLQEKVKNYIIKNVTINPQTTPDQGISG